MTRVTRVGKANKRVLDYPTIGKLLPALNLLKTCGINMNFLNSTTTKVSGLNFHGPFSSAQPLLNQSGVYVILTRGALPGSQWQVLDVGESGTLRSRIENHGRRSQWTAHSHGQLSVAALYTQGLPEDKRRQLEQSIRQQYQPLCGMP
jgi:hypothetical protein